MTRQLKPDTWFIQRKLDFKPGHFVTAKTPLHRESAQWIIHKCSGRFTFEGFKELDSHFDYLVYPSFEDPAEAMQYELTWS